MRTQIYHIIFAALFIWVCMSCRSMKMYQQPQVDTEGLFRDVYTEDTISIARIPWREYFSDTLLILLISEGLENNYDLRIAETRIRQAEATLMMARAAFFPSVSITGQVEHNRFSGPGDFDVLKHHTNRFTLGFISTWEVDLWGKMNRQSKARYAQFLQSRSYRDLVYTTLIANIANSYFSLLALDEQLRITNETIELLKISADAMQALMDAGMLNAAAVQQSLALLYATRTGVPDLESRIYQLENFLSLLLGRKSGHIERGTIGDQPVPEELQHGVPFEMLSLRPDVRQAELNFRVAFELTNVARASFYPSITLGSGSMVGFSKESLSRFFTPQQIFANILGGIAQPIFARKQLEGNLEISESQQEEALLSFQETVLSAGKEVSDILYAFTSSRSKNDVRRQQITALRTAVEYTQALLTAGEANYTEVITAQQNLLQAELDRINDKLEQLQAAVNLFRALGGK